MEGIRISGEIPLQTTDAMIKNDQEIMFWSQHATLCDQENLKHIDLHSHTYRQKPWENGNSANNLVLCHKGFYRWSSGF